MSVDAERIERIAKIVWEHERGIPWEYCGAGRQHEILGWTRAVLDAAEAGEGAS